jgi:hypothetical protein
MFESDDQKQVPLPIQVSHKWNFPLAYVEIEGEIYYAVQDWIRGLIGIQDVRQIWRGMQRASNMVEMYNSVLPLPYTASDGKSYQRDYVPDKGLYLIAQYLLTNKSRPALAQIKQFLDKPGAFVDKVRLDPKTVVTSGAIDPDEAIDAAIDAYRSQGKDDRWIQARIEGKIKRKQFTMALAAAVAVVLSPKHYALATDDIYLGLYNRTSAYLKGELNLPKKAKLRDHQPYMAVHYQGIAEEASALKLGDRQELDWDEARAIIQMVAKFVGKQVQEMSQLLNMDIATGKPLLPSNP